MNIKKIVSDLTNDDCAVLIMYYEEKATFDEIAAVFDCDVKTAQNKLYAASVKAARARDMFLKERIKNEI